MSWANVMPLIVLAGLPSIFGFEINKCYCWKDISQNSTLQAKEAGFKPTPVPPPNQYIGVQPKSATVFSPCKCTDVTRVVTNIRILETAVYDNSYNATAAEATAESIRTQINAVLDKQDSVGIYVSVSVTFNSSVAPNETFWIVDVVTKGWNASANSQVGALLTNGTKQTNGSYILPQIGHFDGTTIAFTILQCPNNPLAASANGIRTWAGTKYTSVRATYSCNPGYFISDPAKAYSECSHWNQTWTEPLTNITCSKGCQSEPPDGPYFTIRSWNSTQRNAGNTASYSCMEGYRSATGGNASSTCQSTTSNWTALNTTFKCEQILCPEDIPQVPAFAWSDWDGSSRYIGTIITYRCIDGYIPTLKTVIWVECLKYGNWTKYSKAYECVHYDIALEMGLLNSIDDNVYDYYEDGIYKNNKVNSVDPWTYFGTITVPCIIGLSLSILLCLCCTRTNSPLYYCCRGNTRNTAYVTGK